MHDKATFHRSSGLGAQVHGPAGGVLAATLNTSGGTALVAALPSSNGGSGALNGAIINGMLDLSTVSGTSLTVENGLTLNGVTLNLGNANNANTAGELSFSGTQTLGGTGTINFGFSSSNALFTGSSMTLTIGSGQGWVVAHRRDNVSGVNPGDIITWL